MVFRLMEQMAQVWTILAECYNMITFTPYSFNKYAGYNKAQQLLVNCANQDAALAKHTDPSKYNVSFKSSPLAYQRANANINGNMLKQQLSAVFQYDRDLVSQAYFGEITEETKYSKPGWYLYKKEQENSPVFEKIQAMNPRAYIKLYNDFYNNELKSAYDVAHGRYKYVDNNINNKIRNIYQNNGDLEQYFEERLDEYFLSDKIQRKKVSVKPENQAYMSAQKNEFSSKFCNNPLLMRPEDISTVLDITNNMLDNADKETYLSVYNDINNISQSLYDKNSPLLIDSFASLKRKLIPYWESEILPEKSANIEKQNSIISDFKNSDLYKGMNTLKQMDSLFSAAGFTLEQKTLFARQLMSKDAINRAVTRNFFDFLINNVPALSKKQKIAGNVLEKLNIADYNFPAFKETFIEDVRNKNTDSAVINKELCGISAGTRVADMLAEKDDYMINILNRYTDEDLNKLLDKLKPLWMSTKYKEACEEEEAKYDLDNRFEDISSRLTMKIDGKDVGIYEFVDDSFQKLFGNEAKLSRINDIMLYNILAGRAELQQHDRRNDLEYKYIMEQMESLVYMLSAQNEDSKKLNIEISKVLDKLEKTFPDQSRDIVYVRSTFERIKDGIKKSIFPGALALNTGSRLLHTLQAGVTAGAMTGDPIMLSVLTLMYGFSAFSNIKKEFDKPC